MTTETITIETTIIGTQDLTTERTTTSIITTGTRLSVETTEEKTQIDLVVLPATVAAAILKVTDHIPPNTVTICQAN